MFRSDVEDVNSEQKVNLDQNQKNSLPDSNLETKLELSTPFSKNEHSFESVYNEPEQGYYRITSRAYPTYSMAMWDSNLTKGASFYIHPSRDDIDDQKFRLIPVGTEADRLLRIQVKHSKQVLAAKDIVPHDIIQYDLLPTDRKQVFKYEPIYDRIIKDYYYKLYPLYALDNNAKWPLSYGNNSLVKQLSDDGRDTATFLHWKLELVEPVPHLSRREPIPWSVSLHAPRICYSINQAKTALDSIKELGASMVRIDFEWKHVSPTEEKGEGNYIEKNLKFYSEFVEVAEQRGLSVLFNLYQLPKWVLDKLDKVKNPNYVDYVAEHFSRFCRKVVATVGQKVKHFQLWNEFNSNTPSAIPEAARNPQNIFSMEEYAYIFTKGERALSIELGKFENPLFLISYLEGQNPTVEELQQISQGNNHAAIVIKQGNNYSIFGNNSEVGKWQITPMDNGIGSKLVTFFPLPGVRPTELKYNPANSDNKAVYDDIESKRTHVQLGKDYTAWININCNPGLGDPGWSYCLKGLFDEMKKINPFHNIHIGIDYYPGTWTGIKVPGHDWIPFDSVVKDFVSNPNS